MQQPWLGRRLQLRWWYGPRAFPFVFWKLNERGLKHPNGVIAAWNRYGVWVGKSSEVKTESAEFEEFWRIAKGRD